MLKICYSCVLKGVHILLEDSIIQPLHYWIIFGWFSSNTRIRHVYNCCYFYLLLSVYCHMLNRLGDIFGWCYVLRSSKREFMSRGNNFWLSYDDVIKWKHIPRYWPFVWGIHRWPVNSPHKGQWRGALMFSLICARINGWINNRESGDLRRHCAHYDVIVMQSALRARTPACFTKKVSPSLAKLPFNFNGGLTKPGVASSVK